MVTLVSLETVSLTLYLSCSALGHFGCLVMSLDSDHLPIWRKKLEQPWRPVLYALGQFQAPHFTCSSLNFQHLLEESVHFSSSVFRNKMSCFTALSIVYSSIMKSLSYWTWHAQIPEEFWNGGKENKCQGYSLAHLTLLPPFFLILSISRKLCLFTKNKSCPVNSGKIRIIFYFNSIYHLLIKKKKKGREALNHSPDTSGDNLPLRQAHPLDNEEQET